MADIKIIMVTEKISNFVLGVISPYPTVPSLFNILLSLIINKIKNRIFLFFTRSQNCEIETV